MAKVSIIVPVYNAEKYLDQCVESLVNQTYADIEILLVDDGSKDRSGAICDRWAKADSRIVVIHKQNAGASLARKDGIYAASGKYVCFLDSDDYVEPTFCEQMLTQMQVHAADIVECAYTVFSEKTRRAHAPWKEKMVLARKEFAQTVVRHTIVSGAEAVVMWNKMYVKERIADYVTDYGEDVLEDYLFNMQYYCGVQKYVYLQEYLVNYRKVQNSLSRRCNPRTFQLLNSVEQKKAVFMEAFAFVGAEDKQQAALWYVNYTTNFLKVFLRSAHKHKRKFVMDVLNDPILLENSMLAANHNVVAKLICNKKHAAAYWYMKSQNAVARLRMTFAKAKRIFLRQN